MVITSKDFNLTSGRCYMCGGISTVGDEFLPEAQTKPGQFPIHVDCAEYLRDLK